MRDGRTMEAEEQLRSADREVQRVVSLLVEVGAASPHGGAAPPAAPIPLEQLDTPDTRHLLYLLEKAQEVAERIDAARGRALGESIELLPGESKGTDLAETISEIALRVRTEVHGPAGRE
jgi:hypothetical protein